MITFVDRATRCILGWRVDARRNGYIMQELLNATVQGWHYYSDRFEAYQTVFYWPARHHAMKNKSETYSVEGNNAELRHYLARLARKSRCFSRCIDALRRAIHLFDYAFNRRQLYKQRFPLYPAHLMNFACPQS